eukprot:gnl/TRDRNA2_/TRDRNA2_176187_c0_seq4.p1 gnl/TRDRNA2_/TRDRNA2_176187_c0~~gnl/TRDRNA2_/TRDRNA2_176187_c0_seq4.p1  ORF type:complete len:268 (-),score=34.34 gnl/TRDRNA2_/TRDRNA2_176187_c0_seq4:296-1099(-)
MRQNSRSPSRLRPSSSLALPRGEEQPSPRDRDRSQHTTLHDQVYEGVDHFLAWSKSQILTMPTNEMNFPIESSLSSAAHDDLSNSMGRHGCDPAGTTEHNSEDDNSSGGGSSPGMQEEVVDDQADEHVVNTIEQTDQYAEMHGKSRNSGSITRSNVSDSEQRHASSGASEHGERTESKHRAEQVQGKGEHDPVGMELEDAEQQAPEKALEQTPTLKTRAPDLPGVIPLATSGHARVSFPTSVGSTGGHGNISKTSPAASKMSAMDVD